MLGKVLENIIGFDNKIRAVKLKLGNGAIEYHSISNLYPMEISCPQNDSWIVSSQVDVEDGSEDRPLPTVNNIDSRSMDKVLIQPEANVSDRNAKPLQKSIKWWRKRLIIFNNIVNKCCCNKVNKDRKFTTPLRKIQMYIWYKD